MSGSGLHDVIAPAVHLRDSILALGTLQHTVALQIPAPRVDSCTHAFHIAHPPALR